MLQAVLKSISLIREEELPPQFKLENYFVELSPKEREIHDAFLANRRLLFPHTRICSHPNLLPEHMKNKLPSNNIQGTEMHQQIDISFLIIVIG